MSKAQRIGALGLAMALLFGCKSPTDATAPPSLAGSAPQALAEQHVRDLFADTGIEKLTMESLRWSEAKDRIKLNTPKLKPEDTVWLAQVVGKLKPRFKSSAAADVSVSKALIVVAGPEATIIGGRFDE